MGAIKGDIRSLDYSSYGLMVLGLSVKFKRTKPGKG